MALSAKQLGLKALIVMPQNTPNIKVDAVRGFGGEVLLHGANFDEAKAKAIELSKEKHDIYSTIRSSISDRWTRHVSDGNATTSGRFGLCLCTSRWWWLSCRCGNLLKQFMPEIKIIGVESKDSACLKAALDKGEPTDLTHVGLFADGVAVKRIGDETFRLCQQYLDDMVLVDSDEVCAAMKDLFENVRAVAEPSGALGLAGLKNM